MDEIMEWNAGLAALFERTRACFKGRLSWERMGVYVRGLLSNVERKGHSQINGIGHPLLGGERP